MKKLIYLLLFSTISFAQNYQYALGEAPTKTVVTPKVVDNQLEEIEYFKAYLLPIEKKATLQQALDTYGSVRLGPGNYSGVDIVMKSNQKLYGHPLINIVSNVIVKAGSTNVHLESVCPLNKSIILETGGEFTNCTFKSIKWGILQGTNVKFENNLLLNFGGPINLNCSASGYIRHNKIIRHQTGGLQTILTLKGNLITPSFDNVHLWSNFLTPGGDTVDLDNLVDVTFVGLDAEGWNINSTGTKAMFTTQNIGKIKIGSFGGGNRNYSANPTPSFSIDATDVLFVNKQLAYNDDNMSARTNALFFGANGSYVRNAGSGTGYDFTTNLNYTNSVTYNGVNQTSLLSNGTAIKSHILGNQYTPWQRPTWELLPDPLGANWKANRIGRPDSRAYIQNLIDTNKIADLPEGIFYISSTLFLPIDDQQHGIFGKGTGKTVICAITDDFPIISLVGGQDDKFVLQNITLQGGSHGVYSSQDYGKQHIAFLWIKYVVFRDQEYGFRLKNMVGFDNNFFDNISFVNCKIGFWQEPLIGGVNDNSSFVDKTVFWQGQYINCGIGASLLATRADNLNAWINCKFDGNDKALTLNGNNLALVANSDFTNTKGNATSGGWPTGIPYIENSVADGAMSFYSCNFYNNNTSFISDSNRSYLEGCNLLDNIPVFSNVQSYESFNTIINSTIAGDVSIMANTYTNSIFVNSLLLANPTLSKMLINVRRNVPTVLINEAPNPYPQFLVTQ
jgi:hypothetical protein